MHTRTSKANIEPGTGVLCPSSYARQLLGTLGLHTLALPIEDNRSADLLWARSGAMWLSGHAAGPPRPCPAPLAACAQGAWLGLCALLPHGLRADFDACRLLGERAAISGLARQGRVSPGGACRLLATADGMLALNLVREDDRELLPAWLEQAVSCDEELVAVLGRRSTETLVQRARLLGLAAAPMLPPQPCESWFRSTPLAPVRRSRSAVPLVLDLSALWAGPLCAQLLAAGGARVIKLESATRPDGARLGPARFYDLLNAGKECVALDLASPSGGQQLRALLGHADIVIESARPRALEHLGIDAAAMVAAHPGMVWVSITGYGRRAPMRDWIAYGDDAGVAAGLSWLMGGDRGDPVFCADAIADPLTGLHAALAAQAVWQAGGGQLLDIALRDVVAYCIAAGRVPVSRGGKVPEAALPEARIAPVRAVQLGADTARILAEFA